MKLLLKDIKRKGMTNCCKPRPIEAHCWTAGVRVVANAGGVNTEACVEALQAIAREQGVELSVAMVTGDDLMSQVRVFCEKKKCITPPHLAGLEPATFRLTAERANRLRHKCWVLLCDW